MREAACCIAAAAVIAARLTWELPDDIRRHCGGVPSGCCAPDDVGLRLCSTERRECALCLGLGVEPLPLDRCCCSAATCCWACWYCALGGNAASADTPKAPPPHAATTTTTLWGGLQALLN